MSRATETIIDGAAESAFGEEFGHDQIEIQCIETAEGGEEIGGGEAVISPGGEDFLSGSRQIEGIPKPEQSDFSLG